MDPQSAVLHPDTAHTVHQPSRDRSVGIMIKGIFSAAILAVGIPVLRDRRGPLQNRVEPSRRLPLQKEIIGGLRLTVLRQHPAEFVGCQKSGIQLSAILGNLLCQRLRRPGLFLLRQHPQRDGTDIAALPLRLLDLPVLQKQIPVSLLRLPADLAKICRIL